MLGVFAEFETNLRRERQLEGIAGAKAKGVYKGRPSTIDAEAIKASATRAWGQRRSPSALGLGERAFIGSRADERLAKWSSTYLAHAGGPERRELIKPLTVTEKGMKELLLATALAALAALRCLQVALPEPGPGQHTLNRRRGARAAA